jgi:Protein of unknown function (DUF2939)
MVMIRKLVILMGMVAVFAAAYAVSPLWMAMDLKRAVKTGDLDTLETRIDWPAVRASLKASLAELERAKVADAEVRGLPKPSLWSRIKAAASPTRYADSLIDRYVTPDSVIRLAAAKGGVRALLSRVDRSQQQALVDEDTVADETKPLLERAQRFWSRLHRVQFHSLTQLELEVQDRRVPERRYVSVLELRNLGWRVSSVRVVGAGF